MISRKEFPNPQFERESWRNLNGEWDFTIDMAKTGKERGLEKPNAKDYDRTINLPFCPESSLSGIGNTDFMFAVWYRRTVSISEGEAKGRVILHIGACDWLTELFVNGNSVGTHFGGYSSFSFDITEYVNVGDNNIVIYAEDDMTSGKQACGKQSIKLRSYACSYTRTTGIWQTVWLEFIPDSYIKNFRIDTNIREQTATVSGNTTGYGRIEAKAIYEGREVGAASADTIGYFSLTLPLSELHLWEVGCGRLYDLELNYVSESGTDKVKSYFGMREIGIKDGKFMLNGKIVFQRFILDQGFYPDGIYTAPTDEALINDIKLSMDAGFNGARLHEKVFEPRFLYHCDRMGYLVWGEHANWYFDVNSDANLCYYLSEWMEVLERDVNHPSIIGWCPFNETNGGTAAHDRNLEMIYRATKAFDPSRPCIDSSGWWHTKYTDIYDIHDYSHNLELLSKRYGKESKWTDEELFSVEYELFKGDIKPSDQPIFISECGGIGLKVTENGWGYNNTKEDGESVTDLYCDIVKIFLDCPNILGFCYTQLYDIEQEQNGVYTYEREAKMNIEKVRKANTAIAAIEK